MSNYSKNIWFNGDVIPFNEAKIHVLSHCLHYGTGVFEGIKCYNTPNGPAIFRLEEHMNRLHESAKAYKIKIPYSSKELCQGTIDLISANNLKESYIRPIAFYGYDTLGVHPKDCPVQVSIGTLNWGAYVGKDALEKEKIKCAQILLSPDDTETRRRHLNARATIATLIKSKIVPVINENDTVTTSEIKFGDNDRLAARVAQMSSSDLLILLSDIDGLYDKNPHQHENSKHIPVVNEITDKIINMAGSSHYEHASGGMITKLEAAKITRLSGCTLIICNGENEHSILRLSQGCRHTIFRVNDTPLTARKKWIAAGLNISGNKTVDDLHKELGKIMWDNVGMSRSKKSLQNALALIPQLKDDFWNNINIPGKNTEFNPELEKAGRLADFIELGELMAHDALAREESCGGHFREEHQTDENEARRDDEQFAYVAAWEYVKSKHKLHQEKLDFENVKLATRSYK